MSSETSPGQKKPKRPSSFDGLREYAPFLTMGFQLAAAVVVFFLLGVWADDRYGTSPWFTLGGLLIGAVGGFIKFFRTVSELEKKDSTKGEKRA